MNRRALAFQHMDDEPPGLFGMMQWHHAEVTRVPDGAEVLASSSTTPVQIMAVGEDILATQFHAELTPALISRWAHIPQYLAWLDQAMGADAYRRVLFENLTANHNTTRVAA